MNHSTLMPFVPGILSKTPKLPTVYCIVLFTISSIAIGYSATQHSPTELEPAFLASGVSHWELGTFDLYRVNPPLPRLISSLPVLAMGYETDWSRYTESAGSRSEFSVGEDFLNVNGAKSLRLIVAARWAGIPIHLFGGLIAFLWARRLYGENAACITLMLYLFEPNLLAHGELITPDSACVSFGLLAGYTFWHWLRQPTWTNATVAGASLGLAELSKLTWVFLFVLWPILWILWCRLGCRPLPEDPNTADMLAQSPKNQHRQAAATSQSIVTSRMDNAPSGLQLIAIIAIAIYSINLGYAFDNCGTPLRDFVFVSSMLTGNAESGVPGNRFRGTMLSPFPVPLPRQYVLGIDSQKKDLESYGQQSFLRGEWKKGGWWYYYLYGLLVKLPCGNFAILILVCVYRGSQYKCRLRDEMVLLAPACVLMLLASYHTEINCHLRYVFPIVGVLTIFLGQASILLAHRLWVVRLLAFHSVVYTMISVVLVFPHQLAYFNDFVGGPRNGFKHILGSSFDWGQDWLYAVELASLSECKMRPLGISESFTRSIGFPESSRSRGEGAVPCSFVIASRRLFTDERYRSRFRSEREVSIKGYCLCVGVLDDSQPLPERE